MAQKRAEDTSGLCVPSVSEARVATRLWNPVEELEAAAGSSSRWEVDKDFLCPICIQMMKDAFLTPCGHSFCYSCIKTHLHNKNNCPSCAHYLTVNQIIPNFLLNKLLKKASMCQVVSKSSLTEQLRVALQQGAEVSVKELDSLLSLLVEKKRKVEQEEAETNMEILLDFLNRLRQQKQHELNEVQEDLQFIKEDIGMVEKQRQELVVAKEQFCLRLGLRTDGQDATLGTTAKSDVECFISGREHSGASVGMSREENHIRPSSAVNKGGGLSGNISESGNLMLSTGSSMARKKRILDQGLFRGKAEFYDGLQECYLQKRRQTTGSHVERHLDMCEEIEGNGEMSNQVAGLERFKNVLNAFTRYSRLRLVSEVRLGDLFHSSNIVSSIEFDRDDEMFATAGVSKRIKIFEFTTIVNGLDDMHCPVAEMSARWKLSCLSWNKYTKGQIASSDYEGTVTVWDIETRQSIMEYEEHEKRAWSVDFSRTEPSRLVSGSDDGKVKIWCTKQEASALTIDMKANVCSVKYNPASSNFVAVGSADHHIHYYDIRHVAAPLHVFSGHRKAVSYVKFLSSNELASASTDSTLRLWDVKNNSLVRTLEGHTNEKNFVGLTVNGDFLACGSETNEVYVYHKEISKPAISNRFGSDPDDDTSHFISAVCWKSDSPTLLAANSQGTIRVLVLAS